MKKPKKTLLRAPSPSSEANSSFAGATLVTPENPIGFNGYPLDKTSGCYYLGNGYRLYNPQLRAFYSADDLSPFGAAGISRYQYCEMDPVNFKDPSGHSPIAAVIALVGFAATLVGVGLHLGASYWRRYDEEDYANYLDNIGYAFDAIGIVLGVTGKVVGISGKMATHRALVRSGSAVKWGRITSIKQSTSGIELFTDIYKGGSRLNIRAHGEFLPFIGKTSQLQGAGGKFYKVGDVHKMLISEFPNLSLFKQIRVISCSSANGGATSFGQRLAKLTNLPVKAYKGAVYGPTAGTAQGRMYPLYKNAADYYRIYPKGDPFNFERVVFYP